MLTCDVAQRSLSALADGEAPDAPEPDVRDHVDACADCRGFDARIAVLTGLDTKGLEFDGIVVVEPGEIESESATGRATLYVVLTRATQQMVTVFSS